MFIIDGARDQYASRGDLSNVTGLNVSGEFTAADGRGSDRRVSAEHSPSIRKAFAGCSVGIRRVFAGRSLAVRFAFGGRSSSIRWVFAAGYLRRVFGTRRVFGMLGISRVVAPVFARCSSDGRFPGIPRVSHGDSLGIHGGEG